MAKIIQTLILLFGASVIAIVAGHYNSLLGMDWHSVEMVFEHIPVIKTAIILTLACPATLLFAFFTSRGNYSTYEMEGLACSMAVPILIVMLLDPGAEKLPSYLNINGFTLYVLSSASQFFAIKSLSKKFWLLGGREIEQN